MLTALLARAEAVVELTVTVENPFHHHGQRPVPGHVAGRAETVLQSEDGQQQGHARRIEMEHARHEAERGHDRPAGHAGGTHGEDAEQHDEEGHRTHGRQRAVQHQADGHDEKGFGQNGAAQVHGRAQGDHEFRDGLAQGRGAPRAGQGHGQRGGAGHGPHGGEVRGQVIAQHPPRVTARQDAADAIEHGEPDKMAHNDDADDLEENGELHGQTAFIGKLAERRTHEKRQDGDDDPGHDAGHDGFKLGQRLVDDLGLGPAHGEPEQQRRDQQSQPRARRHAADGACGAQGRARAPMEQVQAIGEDYKTRILRNGYSLRSYYHRWSVECVWMRQYDKAKEYIDKMLNEKIDDQSCEACELNFMLDYYLETGQFDEAYSRAQPLINKQVTCYEANLRAYLKLAYYAQKAGKPEIAADMCARAEEALVGREKDEYLLLYLGLFIAYYMMTKPERAWEYAERCIGWSLRTNTLKSYRFSCDMVEALKYETRPEVSLSLPEEFPLYRPDGIYQVNELRNYFYQQAEELACRYDARNGNSGYMDRLKDLMSN